jgi:hypothetical protein
MDLLISSEGVVRCLYDERVDLPALGRLTIRRASHVEATSDGQWTVDLSPLGGPKLGPYLLRSTALTAEEDWITSNWLPIGGQS